MKIFENFILSEETMKELFDSTDRKIMKVLTRNGRIPNVDLASEVGIAPSATLNRMRKLEQKGLIRSFHAKIDEKALGIEFTSFVALKTDGRTKNASMGEALAKIPGVLEVHQTAGEFCFMVKLKTANTAEFAEILNEKIKHVPGIAGTASTIVLSTFKESTIVEI